MRKYIVYWILLLVITLPSCKKDSEGSGLKAVFSYVADGYKVNFTNFSSNATEYSWDFGDNSGATSTSKTPQHIFTKKGDFLVSLTAKNGTETSKFTDTVSIIGPNIKIDGDFTDWQYVEYTYQNPAGYNSSLLAVKTFASADMLNFYIEGTADMKMELFDMYVDADNKTTTGFATWMYPAGSGADNLLEGSPFGGWGDVYNHGGAPTDFSWTPVASFAEAVHFSSVVAKGSKRIVEFSIKKSVLGTTKNFVNFAFIELTSGWADIGRLPEAATPGSKFIAIPL
jgi:PKD domain